MKVLEFLWGISKLFDSIESNDSFHQRRVAFIAYKIADQMGFDEFGKKLILQAGLIHDIGIINDATRIEVFRNIAYNEFEDLQKHAIIGSKIARFFNLHLDVSLAISTHHTKSELNHSTLGNILFLADNLEILYRSLTNPFAYDELFDFIASKRELFDEDAVKALEAVVGKECFWFGLVEENLDFELKDIINSIEDDDIDEKLRKAAIYTLAFVSDSIQPFFDNYSVLMKNIAVNIGYLLGVDIKILETAALLSHVGNLVIPFDLFGFESLDQIDYEVVKSHTTNAKRILNTLGFKKEAELVYSHHENASGSGYPCKAKASIEQQVLSLASVVAAVLQDRPYREMFSFDAVKKLLEEFRSGGVYSSDVIDGCLKIDFEKLLKTQDEYYESVRKLFV
ncbi:HD-GYP domain-containing protein [Hippea jasoniae]|uniref:HD-GYP domain-containing protein n=1 Tax=Hippea jasoniae TaxID=944479 RepID=UPI000557E059|nr:HD domain-containing protein [Hippea jasoniae]